MNICIIKLGALGDVVRTTPILEAIKEKYPDSKITWITKNSSKEILTGNSLVKEILTIPLKNFQGKFDILYNFDLEEEATSLASQINAEKKYGYGNEEGFPCPFNISSEYYLNTVFDDELKKSNRKTYQEMIFEIAELPYRKQKINLFTTSESEAKVKRFIEENNLQNKKIIGLNLGSSKRWPSKAWNLDKIKEFILELKNRSYEVILLGGEEEKEKISILSSTIKNIYYFDTSNSIKDFFALIKICDKVVCADTLALHVSLAFQKPTIALFFCTTPDEVEGYDLLKKIVSPLYHEFFPEKQDQYDEELINSISVEEVLDGLE